jgi:hypothetical protein
LFVLALITSALIFAAATAAIARGGAWIRVFFILAILFTLILPLFTTTFTPTIILSLTLFFPVLYRKTLSSWRHRALVLGLPCLIAAAATTWFVHADLQQIAQLREAYPLVSLEGRLPPSPSALHTPVNAAAERRLEELEARFDERRRPGFFGPDRRVLLLKELHEDTVRLFIDSPGFGSARMTGVRRPSLWNLRDTLRPQKAIEQPLRRSLSASAETAETENWKNETASAGHNRLLDQSIEEFVNASGFGFVKSRSQVAGFQSHQFGAAPNTTDLGKLATVELIGLLLYPEPVAYVSPHLPNMEELRGAPTRLLDRFESAGLEAIKRGEDLFVGITPNGVRMLGAIRSAKQCLQCHEGNRGDLLGTFSYRLEPNGK